MDAPAFPRGFFDRVDASPDTRFYAEPRFVTHSDDATIAALTRVYRELLAPEAAVLDLMSSWVSHLPGDVAYTRIAGLGMNRAELEANPRLTEHVVHDLNAEPELPYEAGSFDAVVNAVSIQYLTRPVEVFRSVRRVLRPGGIHLVAMSHRMFPTKAVRAWHALPPPELPGVVALYFAAAGGYGEPVLLDRSPPRADPLWIVHARRSSGAA